MWLKRKKPKEVHPLDRPLLRWNEDDVFRVRDLLNGGCICFGRSGSAKTTGFGRTMMQAIVDHPDSGGLILAAKPEDALDVWDIFKTAKRLNDLIVFSADSSWRCNFLQYLGQGQTRNVVQALMMMGQSLKSGSGKGGNDDQFWQQLNERYFYNAVAALQAAGEEVTPNRILRFLMTAATDPKMRESEEWQRGYHNQVLEKAAKRQKTPLEEHDFKLCLEFWVNEFPFMDPRTRGNGMAGVMNVLHTFNTGLVREMVAGDTNVTPDAILKGHWVLVNFPPSAWGAVGSFICSGWKYITQLAVLQRKAEENSPFVTVWCDEAHQFVNDFDSHYIAQCRSHRGCLVYLTQSVSSFYAAMNDKAGKHQADALLANFSHVIVHASDPETAKWASSKLGKRREILYGGNTSPGRDSTVYDELFGNPQVSSSFSEHYEAVLQDWEWMVGRTGGPDNNWLADAIVIRSGERFSDGKSYKRVTFSQRG